MKKLKLLLLLTAMLLAITETQAQRKKAPVVEPVGMGDGYPPASDETPPVAETPVTEEPKKEITDADYKKQFDLLTLYTFLGNYIDSNRAEIKREGESVFYKTEARFPGTVDNYIEVKQGKGELKYVFYSGNDYTAAMNKYRELEEICKRIKENDLTVTESKYCEGCYGLRFGAEQSVHYWLQVINKPAGGWDVMIIHAMGLDKYYLKEVPKPVATATATTNTITGTGTANTTSPPTDICQSLEFLYKSAAKSYDDIRVGDNMVSQDSWPASYMPKGAAEATLSRGTLSRNLYYTAIMHKNTSYETALAFYKKLVDDLKECSFMLFLCKTPVTFSETPGPSYLKNTDTSMASYLETIADYGFWKRFGIKVMFSKWQYEKDPDLWQVRLEINNNYTGK